MQNEPLLPLYDIITDTNITITDMIWKFSGETFVPEFDAERLTGQWKRVWSVMRSGEWLTLSEIQGTIYAQFHKRDSEAGISARTRDFKKKAWGSHTVNKRRRGPPQNGLWEYQLVVRQI